MYQLFKFSSFYQLLSEHPNHLSTDHNVALNVWYLSKYFKYKASDSIIISGLDTWIMYFLTGYSPIHW